MGLLAGSKESRQRPDYAVFNMHIRWRIIETVALNQIDRQSFGLEGIKMRLTLISGLLRSWLIDAPKTRPGAWKAS